MELNLKAFITILFPHYCFLCDRKISSGYLCPECYQKLPLLRPPLCRGCSKELSTANGICWHCQNHCFSYDNLFSCLHLTKDIRHLIHLFKYSHYTFLAELFSDIISRFTNRIGFSPEQADIITCFPTDTRRVREKGYNQSLLLAKHISQSHRILFDPNILISKRKKAPQTRLSKQNRQRNVHNLFSVQGTVKNKHVLLIDDVYTTGATIEACCQELKKHETKKVTVITLARTQSRFLS